MSKQWLYCANNVLQLSNYEIDSSLKKHLYRMQLLKEKKKYIKNSNMSLINYLKQYAIKLKKNIPALFLAMKDEETPLLARLIAAFTVGYALSPIDLIPDFVPVLGYLDDVILLPLLITLTIKLIPKTVWARCQKNAEDMWENGKPKKWYYALPIVLIWLLIILMVVKNFL